MNTTLSLTALTDAPAAAPQNAEQVLMQQGLTSAQIASLIVQLGKGSVQLPCTAHLHERADTTTTVRSLDACAELVRSRANGLLTSIVEALKHVADAGMTTSVESDESHSIAAMQNSSVTDRSLHNVGGWRTM